MTVMTDLFSTYDLSLLVFQWFLAGMIYLVHSSVRIVLSGSVLHKNGSGPTVVSFNYES